MHKQTKTTFGDFLNISMGQSPEAVFVNQEGAGVPLLNGPAEFTGRHPEPVQFTTNGKRFAMQGDILFCVRGSTAGRINIADTHYAIGRGLAAISHKNGRALAPFVKALLEYHLKDLLRGTLGSVFPGITRDQLMDFECVVPDLPAAKAIAHLLSSLETKIALNHDINARLDALVKTIYNYWFVQFDFPGKAGEPYAASGGKMVYNAALKKMIPEGWEVKTIADVAATGSGGTPASTNAAYYAQGDIPWINSGELNKPVIIAAENYITALGMKNSNAKLFPAESVLVAMYGATAGKVSYLKIAATTNQAVCAIMPYEKEWRHYIRYMLDGMYQHLVYLSSGSARDNLSQDKIRQLLIVAPPKQLLQQFDATVNAMCEKYFLNLKQNQSLAGLRAWLIPGLLNGAVSIDEDVLQTTGVSCSPPA
ncbi:restriction endonuclease subunit S [Deminuibacter soli]|uniref:Restriction endonuclease subunit S n=1 Tax=Deminuibacter soli TaxID=2291815 RepID=A0A3E1NP20_9BACT|nr:restriction endonuclease subunit S [Deminuibacter soli]RFM29681.1 restriction endonuclease subunit S [Deminuibacter soli]